MIYFYKPLNRVLVSFVSFFIILIFFSLVFLTRVKASTVFTDNFNDNSISGSWDVSNGTWVESNGVLSMTDFTGGGSDEKKAAVTSFPPGTDYTITAKVRVDSWTDGPTARVGVSVLSDPNPVEGYRGYNLLFTENHSKLGWLDDGLEWGPSYTFNWTDGTWYWFKVKYESNILYGKVWADGDSEPETWLYTWERSGRSAGYVSLDGGQTGGGSSSLASFDDVTVTTPLVSLTRPIYPYHWTRTIGGTSYESGRAVATDTNGNAYVVGFFYSPTFDFNTTGTGNPDIKTNNGGGDIFISKFNPDGSYGWTRTMGAPPNAEADIPYAVTTDLSGNIFMTGHFAGTDVDFNTTGSGSPDLKTSIGPTSIFITKYNADGSYGWTRTMGGSDRNRGHKVVTDSNGNIYLTGFFSGSNVNFNTTGSGGTDNMTSNDGWDIFITKYNADGSYGWTRTIGGGGMDEGKAITTDINNNIYVQGFFTDSTNPVNFNTTGTGSADNKLSSPAGNDIFLLKYNSDGSYGWTKTITVGTNWNDTFTSELKTDSSGNIYMSGSFVGIFDTTGIGGSEVMSSNGSDDIYLVKINANESFGWVRTIGGSGSDTAQGQALDLDGSIYIVGGFEGSDVNFNTTGSGDLDNKTSVGTMDSFITKFTNTGAYGWTRTTGGPGNDSANGVAVYNNRNLYVTGFFWSGSSINFNNSGFRNAEYKTSVGNSDMFLTKYARGYGITNLDSSLNVYLTSDWQTSARIPALLDEEQIGIKNETNAIIVNDVNFSDDLDWSSVRADADSTKSYFHTTENLYNLSGNESTSYTLYVLKGNGDKVWICPGADSLEAISLNCFGGYYLDTSSPNVTLISQGGVEYWAISGMTGTGGMTISTGLKDTLSRLKTDTASNHTISFGTANGLVAGDTMEFTLDSEGQNFDLTNLEITDIELSDDVLSSRTLGTTPGDSIWGVTINKTTDTIIFTAPTSGTGYYSASANVIIKIGTNATGGVNQIVNPTGVGNYQEEIVLNNTPPGENGYLMVPIVDSDQVNITAFVNAFMSFDIDTTTVGGEVHCDASGDYACLAYEGGPAASNYTVDLGELKSTDVNRSNDAAVMHSDGILGVINSIYFDFSTNAQGGATVTVASASDNGLVGPSGSNILPVTNGNPIGENSGKYGFNVVDSSSVAGEGVVTNTSCNIDDLTHYCGSTTTPIEVFNTSSSPIDTARVRMDIAAAAAYTNTPGAYTDTLTFVATAMF